MLFSKYLEKLDDSDKLKKKNRLRSARKGVLTRTRNKIKRLREEYRNTLTPDGYVDDIRYKKLKVNLQKQEKRFTEALEMKISDISDYTGSLSKVGD